MLLPREGIANHLIHYWGRHMRLTFLIKVYVFSLRRLDITALIVVEFTLRVLVYLIGVKPHSLVRPRDDWGANSYRYVLELHDLKDSTINELKQGDISRHFLLLFFLWFVWFWGNREIERIILTCSFILNYIFKAMYWLYNWSHRLVTIPWL